MRLNINVRDRAVQARLSKLGAKAGDLSKPMQTAGLFMERELKNGFARQSDPDGRPWAALRPATLRRKRGRAILRESGALAASVALLSVSSSSARIGSTGVRYGIFHQAGTSKMAQRKFIGIGDRHVRPIVRIFEAYFGA